MRTLAILSVIVLTVRAQVNCNGGALSPAQRVEVVAQHNRLRSSIAKGAASPGPRRGQNIYALSYDCTLESQAQAQANRCVARRSPLSSRFDAGENFYMYTGNAEAPGAIAFAATQWWNQIFRGWIAGQDNMYSSAVHATGIDMYAQMAWGATTRIGCGVARCGTSRSVVCQYRTGGPQINQVMVQDGPGCTANEQCTTFPNSTCDFALQLCQAPANTDPIPPVTTMGPSATTGPTTTTTLSPLELCTASSLLTAALRQQIIDTHNSMRSDIVTKMTVGTTFTNGCQDMLALKYDCILEAAAIDIADKCVVTDVVPAAAPVAGKNGFEAAGHNPVTAVKQALDAWMAEVAHFTAGVKLNQGVAPADRNQIAKVGRFAQMAYSKSFKVGCGISTCMFADVAKSLFLCKYEQERGGHDTEVFKTENSNTCRKAKCEAASASSVCNTTSGLCEIP